MPMSNAEFNAATIGDRVYLAGGFSDESALLIYRLKTDTWSRCADLAAGNHHPGVAALDGKLYVIGGHDTESLVQIYDPATDTWSSGAPMPFPRRAVAIVVLAGMIHVIGGTDTVGGGGGGRGVAAHEAYDPVQDSWTTLASLPDRREHAYAGVIDGKIYLASGRMGGGSSRNPTCSSTIRPPTPGVSALP